MVLICICVSTLHGDTTKFQNANPSDNDLVTKILFLRFHYTMEVFRNNFRAERRMNLNNQKFAIQYDWLVSIWSAMSENCAIKHLLAARSIFHMIKNHHEVRCHMQVLANNANDNKRRVHLAFQIINGTLSTQVPPIIAPNCDL